MKRTVYRSLIAVFCIAAGAPACSRQEKNQQSGHVQTQTVAPAAAQPAPTGTDAMTQTVDVENGRSEEDGGATTAQQSAPTAPAPKAAPAKKPKSKK